MQTDTGDSMSLKNDESTRQSDGAYPTMPATTVTLELKSLLGIYEQLIGLLNEGCDEGLEILTESLAALTVRCRAVLSGEMVAGAEQARQQMLVQMREGLREFPQTLRSLLPGIGPRLGESLQHRLGIQFSRF